MNANLRAIRLFRAGHDSVSIALCLNVPEPDVCRAIAKWLDNRQGRLPNRPAQDRRASA